MNNCVYLPLADAIDYCAANPFNILPTAYNCAQYYNCTQNKTAIGEHVMECTYPELFSTNTSTCEMFDSVQCTTRKEPQTPCM